MKVTLLNKTMWKDYLAVLGVIGIFTSFITIFITIADKNKYCSGIIFLIILVLIFFYLLLSLGVKSLSLTSINNKDLTPICIICIYLRFRFN